jgi:glycosyltransferase involved in cell wall biosynthesis
MQRILMTADAVGGVWTYALDLARGLRSHGLRTTLATMGPRPSSDQLEAASGIPDLDVVSSDFRLEWMDDPWRDVETAGEWLLSLEASIEPVVVHLNGYAHGALAWRSPLVMVGHSCVASWSDALGHSIDASRLNRYRRAATDGLRSADHVVCPSAWMLASLQRHYGPLSRTSVVPNGRDADPLLPLAKAPFVFTAGRLWDRAKNVETVAAVAPWLSWPVIAAGDGAVAGIRCLGPLSAREMARCLGRASIFVLPARYEPFGLLPLEAALCGCALVLGDIGSLREVWGDAAQYVNPEDRDALRETIESLIASPARLQQFATLARERAAAYTPERMAAGYLDVYELARGERALRELTCAS